MTRKKKMNCLPIKQNIIIFNVFYKVSLKQEAFGVKVIIEKSNKLNEAANLYVPVL